MVSVIIPTYERPYKVADAIKSVQQQSFDNIEILIVDDNGLETPNQLETKRIVSAFNDSRIRYVAHEKNKGGCAARNTGIKEANGEYVAFLDDDDIWSKRFLEKMLLCFTDNSIGAVYSDFWSFNGKYSTASKKQKYFEGCVFKELLKGWCPASTSLFLIKKTAIVDAGCFDEKLSSFQDYDMWLRLSKVADFKYCNEKLVIKYEGIGEQTSKNPKRRFGGLETLSTKYESILMGDELELFRNTKEMFYYTTLFNSIFYFKTHKKPYKNIVKEYLKKFNNFASKIHIFLKLYLPNRFQNLAARIYGKHHGIVYYKGIPMID